MSKEQWLANYERSEECSRMINRPVRNPFVATNVNEKTVKCDLCGLTYFMGEWPFCPHDKGHYSWHLKKADKHEG
jgi:hypothetical protein